MEGALSAGRILSSTLFTRLTPYTTTPEITAITPITMAKGSHSGVFFFFLRRRGAPFPPMSGCAGRRGGGIITWGCAGAALFLLETLLKHVDSIDYLQSRLDGWTQDLDRMTSQTKQSLYAIGSGGATGLGLGNSIEKQLWLPESTNDFIFSVVCEELGFVGAVIVIVLFVLFLVQGFWIAFHAENRFCTLVGIGIMAQIAWQVFCNIAVVTNTLPNTGISLPFFSSGGTSLILLLAEMGVMVNIGRNGERARLEREEAHAERERQRKAKTIVLDTARRAQTEQ